ncbi:MAG: glycosyltransferase [Synechococcaceae cyanobacterium]|jgi:glycosyltransferase involved in cell wall biosynthesis
MDITLLSTADWDHPFWTNKQHVARELARQGHRVLYIDSLGLRPVLPGAGDRGRILRRLARGLRPLRAVEPRLWVCSPLVLPGVAAGPALWLNRLSLRLLLALARLRLGFRRQLLWTYSPLTARLIDPEVYGLSLYHCVDDISAQPGMPTACIDAAEPDTARRVHLAVVTTPALERRLAPAARRLLVLPNVVDADHFAHPDPVRCRAVAAELAPLGRPVIGFVGAISAYKLDLPLLLALARAMPQAAIVCIGAVGEGDPATDGAALAGQANLHLLGPRPYHDLPAWLAAFDVAILPSRRNAYTEAMFPMKFFEYLAAGLPVVAIDLPALRPYADQAWLCGDAAAFLAAVPAALADRDPARRAGRQALARRHTYRARTRRMLAELVASATQPVGQAAAAARNRLA